MDLFSGKLNPNIIIFIMILPTVCFILIDSSIYMEDTSYYAMYSQLLYKNLIQYGIVSWFGELFHVTTNRPPMLVWIAHLFIPVGELLGSSTLGILIPNMAYAFASLALLNKSLTRLLGDARSALAGCLFISSNVLFIGLSTRFWVEPLQMLLIIWPIYIWSNLKRWPTQKIINHLVLATSLGLLVKYSTTITVLAPSLIILHHIMTKNDGLRHVAGSMAKKGSLALTCITLVSVFTCAGFYYINIEKIHDHAMDSTKDKFIWPGTIKTRILLSATTAFDMIFTPVSFLGFILLILSAIALRGYPDKDQLKVIGVSFAQIMIVILFYGIPGVRSSRLFLVIIPFASIIIAAAYQNASRKIQTIFILLLIIQFIMVNLSAFGESDAIFMTRDYQLTDSPAEQALNFEKRYYFYPLDYKSTTKKQLVRITDVACQGITDKSLRQVFLHATWKDRNQIVYHMLSRYWPNCIPTDVKSQQNIILDNHLTEIKDRYETVSVAHQFQIVQDMAEWIRKTGDCKNGDCSFYYLNDSDDKPDYNGVIVTKR